MLRFVPECEILPQLRKKEAPFGEYPGTYGPQRNNPVVQVKAITMRRDALYQSSFVGHADNLLLSGIVRSTTIMKMVKMASPKVRAVHVPASGRCRFICYVSIEKIIEGEPKNAAMAAFAADPFLKYVVVVDQDVNILNDEEVLHAIATQCGRTRISSWLLMPKARRWILRRMTLQQDLIWSPRWELMPPASPITQRRLESRAPMTSS